MKKLLWSLLLILPSTLWAGTHVMQDDASLTVGSMTLTTGGQGIHFADGTTQTTAGTGGGGGYSIEPATVTIQANLGITASTATLGSATDTTLGNNPWMKIDSSGTSQGLIINLNGQPSGGVQNKVGGVTINALGPGGPPIDMLVLRSSYTSAQGGSAMLGLWNDNPLRNDPMIWLHRVNSDSSPEMRWDGPSPNMEMVMNRNVDNTIGEGKWEPFAIASGSKHLQCGSNRANDNGTFENLCEEYPLYSATEQPGIYLHAQTLANDSGILSSSDTATLAMFTLNSHTVGITAPQNPLNSYTLGLPILPKASGLLLYNTGNRGGNFSVRQTTWTDTDFTYATTTGVKVSSLTLTGKITFPGQTTDCSAAGNALTWDSATGKVGCNTITGTGGSGYALEPATVTIQANFGITASTVSISSNTILGNATYYQNGVISGASMNANELTGTLQAAQFPALTGDVTTTAGSLATTAAGTQANITNFSGSITNTSSVTVNSTLQVSTLAVTNGVYLKGIHSVNANYTAVSTDTVVLASATPAGIQITLPPATGSGQIFTLTKVDNDSFTVKLQGAGTDLIQSTGNWALNGYRQSISIQDTDTGNWSAWGKGIQITPHQLAGLNMLVGTVGATAIAASSDTVIETFDVDVPVFVLKATTNISTSNGRLGIGLYDSFGVLIASTGITASPGTALQTFTFATPKGLPAGIYNVGFYANNATATFVKATGQNMLGCQVFTNAGGTDLLTSFTPGGGSVTTGCPWIGLQVAGGNTW